MPIDFVPKVSGHVYMLSSPVTCARNDAHDRPEGMRDVPQEELPRGVVLICRNYGCKRLLGSTGPVNSSPLLLCLLRVRRMRVPKEVHRPHRARERGGPAEGPAARLPCRTGGVDAPRSVASYRGSHVWPDIASHAPKLRTCTVAGSSDTPSLREREQ